MRGTEDEHRRQDQACADKLHSAERLAEERAAMAPLPGTPPDLDPRIIVRVPADPYLRADGNDYSLDPRFVGRRVEVRIGQRRITATSLDSREPVDLG